MGQLNVLKASAGSGKTYQLTQNYLTKILENPSSYRSILAVTFTHKATDEMKSRILHELYRIAKSENSSHLSEISEITNLSFNELVKAANEALGLILHNYSSFSISTIDSFLQGIVKSFIYELGLGGLYEIELDSSRIINEAVERLYLDLDSDNQLIKTLMNIAEINVEEGRSWDIKTRLFQLSYEIVKESYKSFEIDFTNSISNYDKLKSYQTELIKIKSAFESEIKNLSALFFSHLEKNNLTHDDFYYKKSGVYSFFKRLNSLDYPDFDGKRINDVLGNPEKWPNQKSKQKDKVVELAYNVFDPLLQQIFSFFFDEAKKYFTAIEILKWFDVLRILSKISEKLREYSDENNLFMLSDGVKLLEAIVRDNDSSFVFEKTGEKFNHFMIDEFQDTSVLQWNNFKFLIKNSLAQNFANTLVGDVKQSIYRWRNGDWTLMAEKVNSDIRPFAVDEKSLDTNWRSSKNVISANNSLFSIASDVLQNQFNDFITSQKCSEELANKYNKRLLKAYDSVIQKYPDTNIKEGLVHFEFFEASINSEFEDQVLDKLPKWLIYLQNKAYRAKDITILVRNNKESSRIVQFLSDIKNQQTYSNYNFNCISNDSLYIKNSNAIKLLLSILRSFLYPENKIFSIEIAYHYLLISNNSNNSLNFEKFLLEYSDEKSWDFIPIEFNERYLEFQKLPLFDLINELVSIFEIDKSAEQAFLHRFLEEVFTYTLKSGSDIYGFFEWWDEAGSKISLQLTDNIDAINVLTIHKSKGLEFPVVIIPFCNWELDHIAAHAPFLWCSSDVYPFNSFSRVPVKYSKKLLNSHFSEEYIEEKFQSIIDNINLLYVANTRAIDCLVSFSPIKPNKKDDSVSNVGELLFNSIHANINLEESTKTINLKDYWNDEKQYFHFGELVNKTLDDNEDYNVYKIQESSKANKIGVYPRIKVSKYPFSERKDELKKYGKLMHHLFENIDSEKDIANAIRKLVFEGFISKEEVNEFHIYIQNLFKNSLVKKWFSGKYESILENPIITKSGEIRIPDRVMISENEIVIVDFKFGDKISNYHKKQISEYAGLLKEMNDQNISSYLWYVEIDEIIEVK